MSTCLTLFFTGEAGSARAGNEWTGNLLIFLLLVTPAFNSPATVFLGQILNSPATIFTGQREYTTSTDEDEAGKEKHAWHKLSIAGRVAVLYCRPRLFLQQPDPGAANAVLAWPHL